jgi:hypothetical protein
MLTRFQRIEWKLFSLPLQKIDLLAVFCSRAMKLELAYGGFGIESDCNRLLTYFLCWGFASVYCPKGKATSWESSAKVDGPNSATAIAGTYSLMLNLFRPTMFS